MPGRPPILRRLATALVVGAALFVTAAPARAETLLVFAAASLRNALDGAASLYRRHAGAATISYAASSALARQIENGAPADIFISADLVWMDYLAAHHLIRPETRLDLFGNTLVLVAPSRSTVEVRLEPGFPLLALLGGGRLAMADPSGVPAGIYGKAALEALGVWKEAAPRLARAENVRAALALVARGEAPLGIVYGTDAAAEPHVRAVATFPAKSHPPIIYPGAVTAASSKPAAARRFLAFLQSPAAADVFRRQGFTVLEPRS